MDVVVGKDIKSEGVSTQKAYEAFNRIEERGFAHVQYSHELPSIKLARLQAELADIIQELQALES